MISGLSTRKKTGSVGLDITCDSIAATEVQNGAAVGRTAIVPLQPGVVKEGDLVNREVLSDALKDLFARHKLSKTVRVGVANQRVVVRSLQLPLIEDDAELETAIRFRAQEAIPMPLDQAVLDHQVVAKRDGAGRQPSDGRARGGSPARHGRGAAGGRPVRRPATRRHRPVRLRHAPGPQRSLGAPGWRNWGRCPYRPASTATSATSPTSPSLAGTSACSRESAPSASRRSPIVSRAGRDCRSMRHAS